MPKRKEKTTNNIRKTKTPEKQEINPHSILAVM
jgi:hypothetical protein